MSAHIKEKAFHGEGHFLFKEESTSGHILFLSFVPADSSFFFLQEKEKEMMAPSTVGSLRRESNRS